MQNTNSHQLVKLPVVMALTAFGRASIFQYVKDGRFPKPIKIGARATAWRLVEVEAWIDSRQKAGV